jgi:hypothetical protein
MQARLFTEQPHLRNKTVSVRARLPAIDQSGKLRLFCTWHLASQKINWLPYLFEDLPLRSKAANQPIQTATQLRHFVVGCLGDGNLRKANTAQGKKDEKMAQ